MVGVVGAAVVVFDLAFIVVVMVVTIAAASGELGCESAALVVELEHAGAPAAVPVWVTAKACAHALVPAVSQDRSVRTELDTQVTVLIKDSDIPAVFCVAAEAQPDLASAIRHIQTLDGECAEFGVGAIVVMPALGPLCPAQGEAGTQEQGAGHCAKDE